MAPLCGGQYLRRQQRRRLDRFLQASVGIRMFRHTHVLQRRHTHVLIKMHLIDRFLQASVGMHLMLLII